MRSHHVGLDMHIMRVQVRGITLMRLPSRPLRTIRHSRRNSQTRLLGLRSCLSHSGVGCNGPSSDILMSWNTQQDSSETIKDCNAAWQRPIYDAGGTVSKSMLVHPEILLTSYIASVCRTFGMFSRDASCCAKVDLPVQQCRRLFLHNPNPLMAI